MSFTTSGGRRNPPQSEDALKSEARLYARSFATNMVLGLLLAKMEKLHPGMRQELATEFEAMTAEILKVVGDSPAMLEEVQKFGRTILSAPID